MKKVLSFVLILALVLSSFSMVFAASATELKNLSDIAGNANEEAIEVNYDLGIITGNPDGTFQPEKAVTRAEFAAMITRALAIPQSALAGYANTSFTDTSGYSWAVPYLAFCNSKGIMLGDGAGNAMPGKTITVNEAVTMSLRAIGYVANSAELTGVWPSNYVTKAQELKMYDDVAKDTVGVDKANAAQIIYNTLGQQKVAVNSDGKTEKQWDIQPNANNGVVGVATTLLSSGLNCYAPGPTVVTTSDLEESLINMAKHIGKYGYIYRNDGGKGDIVAFIEESDETLVGRFYQDGSTLKFVTTADEQSYTVNPVSGSALLTNGSGSNTPFVIQTAGGTPTAQVGVIGAMHAATEFAISVDLTGKTIKEVYGVNAWIADQADQVEKSDIDQIVNDQSLLNEDFPLDDDDNIDYTKFNVVGVKSIKDIAADNIVYVYTDGGDIVKVEVGTQTAEGVIKNFKNAKSDVASKFAIGANTYKNASEVANGNAVDSGSTVDDTDVSDEIKAFLDARGLVYDFENISKADNYAVVEKEDSTGINPQVKLMFADGTEKVVNYDQNEVGDFDNYAVIGYGLDKNGEITDANKHYVTTTSILLSSKSVIKNITGASIVGMSNTSVTAITPDGLNAKIASDAIVFTISPDGKDFDATTIDKVEIDEVIPNAVLLFDEKKDGTTDFDKVVAMMVPEASAKSGDKSYGVLNEKNADANDDGDKVWNVIGFKDGAKLSTLTDDRTAFGSGNYSAPVYNNGGAFTGDVNLYEIKMDANGVVTDAKAVPNKALGVKVYREGEFEAAKADKRNSVTDARGTRYALSSKVVVYQVTSDNEYKVYSGNLNDSDRVILFETNDDEDGYDVVIMGRK